MAVVYHTWLELVWMSVNISSPRFIQDFITKYKVIVSKILCHNTPELGKVVLYPLFIVIEALPATKIMNSCKDDAYS